MLETIGNRAVSTDCHVLDIDILLLIGLAERKNPEKAVFTFSVLLPERFAEICVAPSAPVDGILQSYIHIQSLSRIGMPESVTPSASGLLFPACFTCLFQR